MSIDKLLMEKLNTCLTENGDLAYQTSGSYCLDFFSLCGSSRFNNSQLFSLFIKAYNEDKKTAIQILFYLRDIKEGLGERNSFRFLMNVFANFYPTIASQVLDYISIYGRYDDLLCLLKSRLEDNVVDIIKNQLNKDLDNFNNKKPYSLLAKWMPSINASNSKTRELAILLSNKLGMSKEQYRKTLALLRRNILENYLRTYRYTFNYENVPGRAFNKYKKAFLRNDPERFKEFMGWDDKAEVTGGPIHTDTISPYELVRELRHSNNDLMNEKMVNTIWDNFKLEVEDSKTLIVRDGSGSMGWSENNDMLPIDVADAFTILYSEKMLGIFHNKFITFSSRPQFVTLNSNSLSDKLKELAAYNDMTNTNIEKVYNLILDVYSSTEFDKDNDQLDRIVIISDMEFDQGVQNSSRLKSTFDNFKDKFYELGYKMPEIVYLNVCSRQTHLPVRYNTYGVKLISGSSKNVLDLILKNNSSTPLDFMNEILKKYDFVNNIKWEE